MNNQTEFIILFWFLILVLGIFFIILKNEKKYLLEHRRNYLAEKDEALKRKEAQESRLHNDKHEISKNNSCKFCHKTFKKGIKFDGYHFCNTECAQNMINKIFSMQTIIHHGQYRDSFYQ